MYQRDNMSNRNCALGITFLALAKMVTLNHLREGGKARTGQEIKGRVRMVAWSGWSRRCSRRPPRRRGRGGLAWSRSAPQQNRSSSGGRRLACLPATEGDGAGRGAKAGPDHDARLLAVVLSLANSGYLSKACARASGLFDDGHADGALSDGPRSRRWRATRSAPSILDETSRRLPAPSSRNLSLSAA